MKEPVATKVLVVDDDEELRSMLRELLQDSGFCADFEPDGPRGLDRIRSDRYDLLILDLMLPGPDGFDVLREVRQLSRVPVMILSARIDRFDRVRGFDWGADDYLAKPFFPEELTARMRAILRRAQPQPARTPAVYRTGDLLLMPGTRTATYAGVPLDLTAMECEILEQLFRAIGTVVSRDQLSFHLYNRAASPFDRTIDTHISRIRRKLGNARDLIVSVRGTGYQLCDRKAPKD